MKNERNIHIDFSELIRGEALHDAAVLGYFYSEEEHKFFLSVVNTNGDFVDIPLENVSCMTVGKLWSGAICGYLFAWEQDEIVDTPDGPWKHPL